MNSQSPRRFAGLAVAIVIAALIVGVGIYAASYLGTATTTTKTSTETANEGPLLYTSGVSPEGLQLELVLNSSSVQSHGAITAQIEVFNTLDRNVSVSGLVQNQNISEWNGDDNTCGSNPSSSLVGFAVFEGHYSTGNISAAGPPLQLAPPFYPPCAFTINPNAVTFLPNGDQAIASIDSGQGQQSSYQVTAELNATTRYCTGSGIGGHGGEIDCGANPGLVGYWNHGIAAGGDLNFTSPAFVYFSSGEYTIVATDAWNQYVYATFVVP